jgi:hypothetical protein
LRIEIGLRIPLFQGLISGQGGVPGGIWSSAIFTVAGMPWRAK